MKTFLTIFFTAVYIFGGVAAYNSTSYAERCMAPENRSSTIATAAGVIWPVLVVLIGSTAVLGGEPGIYACGSTRTTFKD